MIVIQLDKDKIEAIKVLGTNMRQTLLNIAKRGILIFEKEAKTQALLLKRSRSAGYKLQSGKLAQSITHTEPVFKGNLIEGSIGSNILYARIQEVGGTITAKDKKLTIPFPGKVYPPARSYAKSGGTFVRKNVVFLRSKNNAIPIYALKSSVVVPAQHWITKAEQKATPRIMELFNEIGKENK